jgi:hypothetical protein
MLQRLTMLVALTALLASPVGGSRNAMADHDTCGSGHAMAGDTWLGSATGSVSPTNRDFWAHDTFTSIRHRRVITLFPYTGDADLYVWNSDCTSLLCSSTATSYLPDECVLDTGGLFNIEVRFYDGGLTVGTGTSYELVVAVPTYGPALVRSALDLVHEAVLEQLDPLICTVLMTIAGTTNATGLAYIDPGSGDTWLVDETFVYDCPPYEAG